MAPAIRGMLSKLRVAKPQHINRPHVQNAPVGARRVSHVAKRRMARLSRQAPRVGVHTFHLQDLRQNDWLAASSSRANSILFFFVDRYTCIVGRALRTDRTHFYDE